VKATPPATQRASSRPVSVVAVVRISSISNPSDSKRRRIVDAVK